MFHGDILYLVLFCSSVCLNAAEVCLIKGFLMGRESGSKWKQRLEDRGLGCWPNSPHRVLGAVTRDELFSQGLFNGFKWAPIFCVTASICLSMGACFHRLGCCNLTLKPWDLHVCVGLFFSMSELHVVRLGAHFHDRKTSHDFKRIPVIDAPPSSYFPRGMLWRQSFQIC